MQFYGRFQALQKALGLHRTKLKNCGVSTLLCVIFFVGCLLSGCSAPIFSKNFDTNYAYSGELHLPAFYAWKTPQKSIPEASHSLYTQLQAGLAQVGLEPALSTNQPEYLIEVELGALNDLEPQGTSTTNSKGRVDPRLTSRPLDAADVLTPLASAARNQEISPFYKTGIAKQTSGLVSDASDFEAFVYLRLYRADQPSQKVYEHRVSSGDFGGDTARAMQPLLKALFQNFPGRP